MSNSLFRGSFVACCLLFITAQLGLAQTETNPLRIVTLGGSVTEVVFALGAGDQLVAVDASSVYPAEVSTLPQLGYFRQVSAEGVLSLAPTLVLAVEGSGPQTALDQIEAAGVTVTMIPAEHSAAGAREKIRAVAAAVQQQKKGDQLIAELDADLARAAQRTAKLTSNPTVMFIYARGGGTLNVSGTDTAADALINLAGGSNAISSYEGFRPLTAESAVAAAPDVLFLLDRGLESLGGQDRLLDVPGVSLTPAGQNRRIVSMDDALVLNFGPRLGEAVLELSALLHPAGLTAGESSE